MRNHFPNLAVFAVLFAGLTFGWWYLAPKPPAPEPPEPPRPAAELVGALAGGYPSVGLPPLPTPRPAAPAPVAAPPPKPAGPVELLPLGDDTFYNQVLLTTRGGAVQQVVLTRFDEADRLGREVKRADGTPQPLRLVPGVLRPRDKTSLTAEAPFPTLAPGVVADPGILSEPSYVLLHYPAPDDPVRRGRADDYHPSAELSDRTWAVAERGLGKVVFETTLDAPYFLKLRKTFTLAPGDYHIGFTLDVEPLPGRQKGKGEFRYQLVAGRGLPIEGEWYAQQFRNGMSGWRTPNGGVRRSIEDAATIHHKAGGDAVAKGENTFTFAAVGTQYFATAVCVDDQATGNAASPWESVRPTREPHGWDDPEQLVYADVTVRAVAKPLDPGPDPRTDAVSHRYLLYNGPLKVRLLKHLGDGGRDDRAVAPELVDRYLDRLTLNTLTDYQSPNVFGRIASAIFWSDLVILTTNGMHGLLRRLHTLVPIWGLNIIMLTVCVRLALMYFSRKQQAMGMRQQAVMAKLKPDLDKLAERHKDDPAALQQAKTRLMMQNGMNPLAMSGGCLLLVFQMPIFMGLYFCLQESVFFRNQPFLWSPNLAAPDMLLWWTEKIPWLSRPESINGMIFLGPYLNLLPLLGVALIFTQQHLSMPPALNDEQAQQQKVMKYMVVLMGVFFYRVPSGLSLYFICSTGWALMERQFIPKPKINPLPPTAATADKPGSPPGSDGTGGGGFWSRMKAEAESRMKDTLDKADQQSQRQIRNDPNRGPRDKKRKRK